MKRKRGRKPGKKSAPAAAAAAEEVVTSPEESPSSPSTEAADTPEDQAEDEAPVAPAAVQPAVPEPPPPPTSEPPQKPTAPAPSDMTYNKPKVGAVYGRVKLKFKSSKAVEPPPPPQKMSSSEAQAPSAADTGKPGNAAVPEVVTEVTAEKVTVVTDGQPTEGLSGSDKEKVVKIKSAGLPSSIGNSTPHKKVDVDDEPPPSKLENISENKETDDVAELRSSQESEEKQSTPERQRDDKELAAALEAINKVMKMDAAEPFNVPVDPVALGIPSAGVQFSNCPNVVVSRAEVPVPETRTEPQRESLSTKLNGGQQEVPTQPAADTRFGFADEKKELIVDRLEEAGDSMASEMVKAATSDKLKEIDWNIEICELVARDPRKAKYIIKAIKKCIGSRSKDTQLYAVMLLEMLLNSCGEPIHRQVIDNGLLPILVKIVKKKTELPVREKIFLLLDATQTSLGGAKARFPQYYEAYYDLVSAGVQFSNRPNVVVSRAEVPVPETRTEPHRETLSTKLNGGQQEVPTQPAADTSIMRKASSVMEVLRDVLNSMDPRHPEGATDEFVLDLVEQCTFQKQRIMHLVMTSRDELMVLQAIELNEELQKVLVRHDALLSVHPTTTVAVNLKEEEEEDAESLYWRLRKGKALSQDYTEDSIPSFRAIPEDKMRRPLTIQPPQSDKKLRALNIRSPDSELRPEPAPLIPPPPSKHAERERFFREKSMDGVANLRGLSLHCRDGSSSCSGSTDSVSGD